MNSPISHTNIIKKCGIKKNSQLFRIIFKYFLVLLCLCLKMRVIELLSGIVEREFKFLDSA